MFDPQRVDPFFLRVMQNAPPPVVQAVGDAIRIVLEDGPDEAIDVLERGRVQTPTTDPAQKILSCMQVGISAVRRLTEVDPEASFERIWNRSTASGGNASGSKEYTVSQDTQVAVVNEMRRQIVERARVQALCPCCTSPLPTARAMAPLVMIDQQLGHLKLYVDMTSLQSMMRQDPNIADIDIDSVDRICTLLAKRAGLSIPVSVCATCGNAALAFHFDPEKLTGFYAGGVPDETFEQGPNETFTGLMGRSMFPHWLVANTGVGPGARVFDFGCGRGTMLKHLTMFGVEAHGLDLDRFRIRYARQVHGLEHAVESVDAYEALPARSFDLVMSSHTLEHVTSMDAHFRRLCDLVRPGGYLAVAVPNGELAGRRKPEGPVVYPMLGGDHVSALTPDALERRSTAAGLEAVVVHRGPQKITDPSFDMNLRDRLTGAPVWTEAEADFVLLARRPA